MTTIRQILPTSVLASPVLEASPVVAGGSTSPSADVGPVQVEGVTGSTSWNNFNIISPLEGLEVVNESPQNLLIEGNQISRIAGFGGTLKITGNYGLGIRHDVNFSYVSSGTAYRGSGFVPGTHPRHAWDIIKTKLDAAGTVPVFSAVNHSTQTYTPSAGSWAADWDFSGVAVWNSRSNNFRRAGTLITRRHIAFTSHYRFVAGDTIRFRGTDGVVRQYTISAVNPGPYFSTGLHQHYCINDVCVAVLNENVHESIAHYPITGTWIANVGSIPESNPPMDPLDPFGSWPQNSSVMTYGRWTAGTNQPAFCALWLNQNRHARVAAIASHQTGPRETRTQASYLGNTINRSILWCNTHSGAVADPLPAFMSGYAATYSAGIPIGGDSSSPIFFPVSTTELALIATFTSDSGGEFLEESLMNAIIAATDGEAGISTGLTVTVATDPTI